MIISFSWVIQVGKIAFENWGRRERKKPNLCWDSRTRLMLNKFFLASVKKTVDEEGESVTVEPLVTHTPS